MKDDVSRNIKSRRLPLLLVPLSNKLISDFVNRLGSCASMSAKLASLRDWASSGDSCIVLSDRSTAVALDLPFDLVIVEAVLDLEVD